MITVRAAPPEDFDWLLNRTGCSITGEFRALKAVDVAGKVRGMVGFDAWTPASCQAHMAADSPMAWRRLLPAACDYAFRQAGKNVVLGLIPGHNERSLALAHHMGFRVVCQLADAWSAGIPLVVHEMRRADCRWLKEAC